LEPQTITLPLAFVAGLLSFASPCVLPLVPAYMGYLGGTAVMTGARPSRGGETARVFFHALLFVLGFMAIFVVLGASATLIGRLLLNYRFALQRVGGVLLVVFGLRLMATGWSRRRWVLTALVAAALTFSLASGLLTQGFLDPEDLVFSLTWLAESLVIGLVVVAGAAWSQARRVILAAGAGALNFLASYDTLVPNLVASLLITLAVVLVNRTEFFFAERRLSVNRAERGSYARSMLLGTVFAAGWTPCVGPILAGILIVASTLQSVAHGVLLLIAYSLGLGIPFLLLGLAFGPLAQILRQANRYLGSISVASGVLLALMGILFFTDSLAFLGQYGNLIDLSL
jgi:cytochrome c-type biogenesis protein